VGWWLGGPGLELTGTRVGATWWSYLPRELVFPCHCCFVRGWLDNILWNYTHDTSDPFFIISVEKLDEVTYLEKLVFPCHRCIIKGWLDNIFWNYTHYTSDPFFYY